MQLGDAETNNVGLCLVVAADAERCKGGSERADDCARGVARGAAGRCGQDVDRVSSVLQPTRSGTPDAARLQVQPPHLRKHGMLLPRI